MKKILWITNIPFAHHHIMLGHHNPITTSGSWLYAAYEASLNNPDLQLHIVTIGNVHNLTIDSKDGHVFYILPGISNENYDIHNKKFLQDWEELSRIIHPDAIIVWGTESKFPLLALKVFRDIPSIVYMQGVVNSIYQHFYDGVPFKYRCRTLRDVWNKFSKKAQYNNFRQQSIIEKEILNLADGVIVENDWCEEICLNINSNLKIFRNYLPIREVFYSKRWDINKIEKYSIFTNAGGYPIKGHHILFQALGIVKKHLPNFRCYVPGTNISSFNSLKTKTGYVEYLQSIIKNNNLTENIIFMGPLSSEEMANRISNSHIYVMPSIVENHSSSLIEALIIGVPSISSLVGGTASLISNNINGILYNSLDSDSLAGKILKLFENPYFTNQIAQEISKFKANRPNNFNIEFQNIYNVI